MNKHILIFFTIAVLFNACQEKKNSDPQVLIFSYKIIKPDANNGIETIDSLDMDFTYILLNFPDTIVTYKTIAKCVYRISNIENTPNIVVYTRDIGYTQRVLEKRKQNLNEYKYIGYLDLRNYGNNWYKKGTYKDFKFNLNDNIPIELTK